MVREAGGMAKCACDVISDMCRTRACWLCLSVLLVRRGAWIIFSNAQLMNKLRARAQAARILHILRTRSLTSNDKNNHHNNMYYRDGGTRVPNEHSMWYVVQCSSA